MRNRVIVGSFVFILTVAFFYLIVLINKQDRNLRTSQMDNEDYRHQTDNKITELEKQSHNLMKENSELKEGFNRLNGLTSDELEKFRTTGLDLKNIAEWQSKKISDVENNFDAYKEHFQKIYAGASYLVNIQATFSQEHEVPMPGLGKKIEAPNLAGFVILGHDKNKKERAFIVTAGHLMSGDIDLDKPYDCEVTASYDFGKETAEAEIYSYDRNYDVALLVFKDPAYIYKGAYAKLGKPDDSAPGSEVIAMGSPTRDPYCISAGLISRKEVDGITSRDIIIHTAGITFGNSGGPLLNSDGEVIGMNIQIRLIPLDKFGMRIASTPFGVALSMKSILFIMPELERGSKH